MRVFKHVWYSMFIIVFVLIIGVTLATATKMPTATLYTDGVWEPTNVSTIQITNSFFKNQELELYVDFLGDTSDKYLLMGTKGIISSMIFNSDFSSVQLSSNGMITNNTSFSPGNSDFIFYIYDKSVLQELFYSPISPIDNSFYIDLDTKPGFNKGGFIVHDVAPVPTPVPPTMILFASGMLCLIGLHRKIC